MTQLPLTEMDLTVHFPHNFVMILAETLEGIHPDVSTFMRPLRPTDPNYSIGVFGTAWQPDEGSHEMGFPSQHEPTLGSYQVGVQTMVKDGDAERGLGISSVLSNRVRTVLYRNTLLRDILRDLVVQDSQYKESLRRWGVRSQRFMSNEIDKTFVTISVLDLSIETEMS